MSEDRKMLYVADSGAEVKLTPAVVRNYLVSGGGAISDSEVMMFMMLCRDHGLNPFLREAYCVKYGNDPATMVVSYDVHKQRAARNADYKGHNAGTVVEDKNGQYVRRNGCTTYPGDTLIGGWCTVYRDDKEPFDHEVSFEEYVGRKKDGTANRQWATKPATMIRKVAVAQALREAFPARLQGLYAAEEFGRSEESMPTDVIENVDFTIKEDDQPLPKYITKGMVGSLESICNGDKQLVHEAAVACGYETVDTVYIDDYRTVYDKLHEIVAQMNAHNIEDESA